MKRLIFIICGFCTISSFGQSQASITAAFTLSQVAMLDLEPNYTTVTLNLTAPTEAGLMATVVMANNKKWLNFSSAVTSTAASRNISVKIDGGQVPPGIYLKLSTSNKSGIGQGVLGTPSGILTLTSTSQNIVSGIRGAFTGDGIGNGYELSYYLEIYDYKLLDFNQSATLSITLTLSDL